MPRRRKKETSNRTKKETVPFTMITNQCINDKNISMKELGIYTFMFSKPQGWVFTIKSMAKQIKDGQAALFSGLSNLKKHGWVSYTKHKDGSGVYTLNTNPVKPKTRKPKLGFPKRISNTDSSNKDINTKDNYTLTDVRRETTLKNKTSNKSKLDKSPNKKNKPSINFKSVDFQEIEKTPDEYLDQWLASGAPFQNKIGRETGLYCPGHNMDNIDHDVVIEAMLYSHKQFFYKQRKKTYVAEWNKLPLQTKQEILTDYCNDKGMTGPEVDYLTDTCVCLLMAFHYNTEYEEMN